MPLLSLRSDSLKNHVAPRNEKSPRAACPRDARRRRSARRRAAGAGPRRAAPAGRRGVPCLFHARKRSRSEDLVGDGLHDLAVALAFAARLEPFRVAHEAAPDALALGEVLPLEQVIQIAVGVADRHGPEAGLPDA